MDAVAATVELVQERARELDVLDSAVIATDPAGKVVYWNDAAEDLYGWSSDEAMGRPIADLTPATQTRDEARRILERLRRGKYWSGEFAVSRRDGKSFVAHVIDAPVVDDTGAFLGIVGLSSAFKPIARLQRLARDLSAALTPAQVADAALKAAMETIGAGAGWFMTLNHADREIHAIASIGYAPKYVKAFTSIPLDANLPICEAIRGVEPLFVDSFEDLVRRYPLLAEQADPRTRCWVAIPLMIGTRVVGGVGLSVRFVRDFPQHDREMLMAISQHAAVALERATLFDAERQARRDAEAARATAEEANRVKSAFLATMSHELRTPLGAVIGYHDLLVTGVAGELNDQQHQYLRRLRNSATHLLSLIDELLAYARLDAARETVHQERVALGVVLDDVGDIVRPLAEARSLDFSLSMADPCALLNTDAQKLRQILVNLGGNAVKYTSSGSVRIHAAVSGAELIASVTDTGHGISADNLERIFDPFWQVENTAARSVGGTGLGLSVARKLARLLGGDIEVRSVLGEGSTFTLRLPATA